VKFPLLAAMVVWQKVIEITAHTSIPYKACLGPGLYLGNLGNIFINDKAVVGPMCSIEDGVTLGVFGRGARRNAPTLGTRVTVGTQAVIIGGITLDDDVAVAPGSLVVHSAPAGSALAGNPARLVASEDRAVFALAESGACGTASAERVRR
jgi:serine O-acetyltransferase